MSNDDLNSDNKPKKRLYLEPQFETFEAFKEFLSSMYTHLTGKELDMSDAELRKDWEELQKKLAERKKDDIGSSKKDQSGE